MPHADRPYPLAGVDQALGEGSARPPAELLDQLRERLRRLDPNHPSASPRSYEPDVTGGTAAVLPDENGQAASTDRSSLRKEGAGSSRDDHAGDQGASEPPTVRQVGQPTATAVDGVASGPASDGAYRVMDAGRAAKGDAYRPWFAGEPGPPWFAEPDFTE